MTRKVHPAEVGWADRVKPSERNPPRTIFYGEKSGDPAPLEGARELLARDPRGFFFADLHAPEDPELDALAREFGLHPLAIEDVRHRHQRPKIDVYPGHYFLVLYRIRPGSDERPTLEEVDVFIGPRFLVLVHDAVVPLLDEVVDRYERQQGAGRNVAGLLYEILDAIVDEYFPMLDALTNRSEAIEQEVFETFARERLQALLELKKDLALLRRIVAPERDSINVLLRRDPPILDPEHIFYFQDLYDHLIRVTDSIDTDRELVTTSLDAFLSVENNRLSEIVRRLTVISTIFLPLNFVTGFFGMNFVRLTGAPDALFAFAIAAMAVLPIIMLWLIRSQKIG